MRKISDVIIYDSVTSIINAINLKRYLLRVLPIRVHIEHRLLCDKNGISNNMDIIQDIKPARITNIRKPIMDTTQNESSVNNNKEIPVIYDGFEIQKMLAKCLASKYYKSKHKGHVIHIVLTDILIGTFDKDDYRYHARTTIIGTNPAIISIPGIINAPARPRGYYIDLLTDFSRVNTDKIKARYDYIDYNDPRIQHAVELYALQAIIYYKTGESFCTNVQCLLYNAHWQKELITQIENKKFCDRHKKILEEYRQR